MNTLQILKKQHIISIRAFLRSLSKITDTPEHAIYTVVKNGKKVGTFIPAAFEDEVFAQQYPGQRNREIKRKHVLDGMEDIMFASGEDNLSMNVDKIVYGVD